MRNDQKEDTKNRLLDAAETLFCEKGFDRVSVRELTAAADCNLAAVNYYFGGKEQLYAEMFRRNMYSMIQEHLQNIDRVMSDPSPTLEVLLRAIVEPPIRRVAENEPKGQVMKLLVREVLNQRIEAEHIAKDLKEMFFERLGDAIMDLVPDLDKSKIMLVVFSFDGVILHPFLFIKFYDNLLPNLSIDELIDHIVRFVAAAIRGYVSSTNEDN